MLLKSSAHDSLGESLGDGFSLHLGKWCPLSPNQVLIRHCLVYRSITKVGEMLPREEISDTPTISGLGNNILKLEMNKQAFAESSILTTKTKRMIERFKGHTIVARNGRSWRWWLGQPERC